MPNVDPVKETVNAMTATRSYEANITAFNAIKTISQRALKEKDINLDEGGASNIGPFMATQLITTNRGFILTYRHTTLQSKKEAG